MIKPSKFAFLGLLFLALCTFARAQVAATSCNTADVQNAINTATEGQTVTIPAGTCHWTSGVNVSGKGIAIVGAGSSRVIAVSSSPLTLGSGSQTLTVVGTSVSNPTPAISVGQTLTINETGNEGNSLTGTVTAWSSSTGSLTINASSSTGTCGVPAAYPNGSNCKRWLISNNPSSQTILINDNPTDNALFQITEDTAFHTNVSGIFVDHGTNRAHVFSIYYTAGGQAVLIHDSRFRVNPNNPAPPSGNGDVIESDSNRGVVWNISCSSDPFNGSTVGCGGVKDPTDTQSTSWSSVSKMGSLSNGSDAFFIEDSDFHAFGYANGADDNARMVQRYNMYNNSGIQGSHGADTSNYGQRFFEAYNNVGRYDAYSDGSTFNLQAWIYLRGGTGLAYNNTLPAMTSSDYGSKPDINATVMNLQRSGGPDGCWGQGTSGGADYHAPRQVGFGYVTGAGHAPTSGGETQDAFAYVGDSEPFYVWGNSRSTLNWTTSDYGGTACGSNPDTSSNYLVQGRDYFNGSTAKPGWSPYTYPQPLRGGAGSTSSQPQTPPAPLAVTAVVH